MIAFRNTTQRASEEITAGGYTIKNNYKLCLATKYFEIVLKVSDLTANTRYWLNCRQL